MFLWFWILIASVFAVDALILPPEKGLYDDNSGQPTRYEDQFQDNQLGNLNSYKSNDVMDEYYEGLIVDDHQATKPSNPYRENNGDNTYEEKILYNPYRENNGENTYEEKKPYNPYREINGENTHEEKKPYNLYRENNRENTYEEKKQYNPHELNSITTYEEEEPYNPYEKNNGKNAYDDKNQYNINTYENENPYSSHTENYIGNSYKENTVNNEWHKTDKINDHISYETNQNKNYALSQETESYMEPYNLYKKNYETNARNHKVSFSPHKEIGVKATYYPDEKTNELYDFILYEEKYPNKEEIKVYNPYKDNDGNNAYVSYEESYEHKPFVLHEVKDTHKNSVDLSKNNYIVSIDDSDYTSHSVNNSFYDSSNISHRPILYSEDLSNYQSFVSECFERKFATIKMPSTVDPNQRTMRIYSDEDRIENSEVSLLTNSSDQILDYETLRSTPHGRHLLMITLLEKYENNYWEQRCEGLVQMYLPDSLKSPLQPYTPKNACHMKEIVVDGYTWTRQDVQYVFDGIVASKLFKNETFSRYNEEHSKSLQSLVKFALWMPDFDSMMSLLVVIRDSCNKRLFLEGLASIIIAREDVGFIVPSLMSIIPENFIPLDEAYDVEDFESDGRKGHQWSGRPAFTNQGRPTTQGRQVIRFGSTHRTYPATEPEGRMWHMREDPVYSSMHWIWHLILNDGNTVRLMRRRGEMFFFMHRQMLNRYNADRLAVGLPPVVAYTPRDWTSNGALIGYTPRLLSGYTGRAANRAMGTRDAGQIGRARTNLMNAVNRRVVGRTRLGYANGVDFGISALGDATEPVGNTGGIGSYHNQGHVIISELSTGGNGVMGGTENAIKDPAFFRWHEQIDGVFSTYKRNLGRYSDNDLDYPTVTVTSISTDSLGVQNRLRTFLQVDRLQVNNNNLLTPRGGRTVSVERITYDPFVFNIQLQSTTAGLGVGRIFLVPTTYANRDSYPFAIEMDKFLIRLNPGANTIQRSVNESPIFSKAAPSLNNLQSNLLRGMSERDFNWANCGYPIDMAIPRGTRNGMSFQLVFIVSPLLQQDRARVNDWSRTETAWGWCGFREGQRGLPDSRPLGYPFDRHLSVPDVTNGRSNAISTPITIVHSG